MSDLILSNRLPELAALIKAADMDVRRSAEKMAASAIEAGRLLIEAKDRLGHGQWLPWLKDHVAMSERTARRYMQLARAGVNIGHVADLGIVGALALAGDIAAIPIPTEGQVVACHDTKENLLFLWPYAADPTFIFFACFTGRADPNGYASGEEVSAGQRPVHREWVHQMLATRDLGGFGFSGTKIEVFDNASPGLFEFLNGERRLTAPTWHEQRAARQ